MDREPSCSNVVPEGRGGERKKKNIERKKRRREMLRKISGNPTPEQQGPEEVFRPDTKFRQSRCFKNSSDVMAILDHHHFVNTYDYWMELFQEYMEIPYILEQHKIKFLMRLGEEPVPRDKILKCVVCSVYFGSLNATNLHMQDAVHLSRLVKLRLSTTCILTPELPKSIKYKMECHLQEVVSAHELTSADIQMRERHVESINNLLKKVLPGCSVQVYGSTYTQMGLKTSDLNLALVTPNEINPASAFTILADTILKETTYSNFRTNFNVKPPYLSFTFENDPDSITCKISINNERTNALSRLLWQYSLFDKRLKQLCVLLRLWGRLCNVDVHDEGSLPSHVLYLMVVCYLLRCRKVIQPIPDSKLKEFKLPDYTVTQPTFESEDTANLSELWLGLLSYYSSDDSINKAIYITQSKPNCRWMYGLKNHLLVFDPFMSKPKKAVLSSINEQFLSDCFKSTYYYYAVPHTAEGPIYGAVRVDLYPDKSFIPGLHEFFTQQNHLNSSMIKVMSYLDTNYMLPTEGELALLRQQLRTRLNNSQYRFVNASQINLAAFDFVNFTRSPPSVDAYRNLVIRPLDALHLVHHIDPAKIIYSFKSTSFTLGKAPPVCCSLCGQENHLRNNCPEDTLPPIEAVEPCSDSVKDAVTALSVEIFEKYLLSERDNKLRDRIASDIETHLKEFYSNARLTLFGSSKNGFGLKRSDVDICLTFDEDVIDLEIEYHEKNLIEIVYHKLLSCTNLKNLLCITTARVPIIKFVHGPTSLEGDISFYNILAVENTALLKAYSDIDERVKVLGTMMKRFTKVCKIGDASKGSLSSYSYTLMVVFYLQRCSPPVLPVLQELTLPSSNPAPQKIVDEWNCYFFNDLDKLPEVWPHYGTNKLSVGELWIDLLRFYTERFDMENTVISIRTIEEVSKFKKLWISKNIAIEDPFNTNLNLAAAITRRMNLYIIQAFRKGRLHFLTLPPSTYTGKLEKYYFDEKVLAHTDPPNDRGCFVCKSIGHLGKNCPSKSDKKDRRMKEDKKSHEKKEQNKESLEITTDLFKNIDLNRIRVKDQSLEGNSTEYMDNAGAEVNTLGPMPCIATNLQENMQERKLRPNNSSFTHMFKRQLDGESKEPAQPNSQISKSPKKQNKVPNPPAIQESHKELFDLLKTRKTV